MATRIPPPATQPQAARRSVPPGPRAHPLLGSMRDIKQNPLAFLFNMHQQYGDVVRYRLAHMTIYLIAHPDDIKRVLQENQKNYTKNIFDYDVMRRVVGNGLVTSEGTFWLRQRRLAQPAFHRQRISTLGTQMVQATEELIADWDSHVTSGQPFDITEAMMPLTLRIVGESLFGTDVRAKTAAVSHAFNLLSADMVSRFRSANLLPPVLPTQADRRFRAAKRALDEVVLSIITERRQQAEDTGDLLSMLLLARDEETGEQMNDQQLRDEVLTLLLAGHETTATALSWVWYLLSQHPEAEGHLHAELETVLGGRAPTMADLPHLNYTRMVIDETMRLYPPAWIFGRRVVADDQLGGYRIPGGSIVNISTYVTHRHPEFWEQPDVFDPERFTPERSEGRPRYAYFPFSGGPRQCIGNTFALVEAQLILATIAQRYRLRLAPGHVVDVDPLVTLRPRNGLPMLLQPR